MKKFVLVLIAFSIAFMSVIAGLSAGVEAAYMEPETAGEPELSGDRVRQMIQEFVEASDGDVTAVEIVAFMDGLVDGRTLGNNLIAYGSEYVFNPGSTLYTSAAALSSTTFVVAYEDESNSHRGTAVIGTVSGNTITYGSEYVFNPGYTQGSSVVALSSTKFVVAYTDEGNSNYGTAVIGDVSGSAITYGSEYVFNTDETFYISAAALSTSKFVVSYVEWWGSVEDPGICGTTVGTISGTTITYGSEYVFQMGITEYLSAAALSTSKFVVAYRDESNSFYGTAVIGDVSGTIVTYGSKYVFNPANTKCISIAALSSAKLVVAYMDFDNSFYGTAVIGDVSGNSISYGSEYVFNPAAQDGISAAALSSTKFVVAYRDLGHSDYGTAVIGDVSGSSILFDSEYVFNSIFTYYITATSLSSSRFVVAYADLGYSNYGTAVIGDWSPDPTPTISPTPTTSLTATVSPTVSATLSPTPSPTATSVPNPGDVNGDGVINACDITQIELCIMYPGLYPKESYPGWDADENGEGPNAGDLQAVELRILEQWPP